MRMGTRGEKLPARWPARWPASAHTYLPECLRRCKPLRVGSPLGDDDGEVPPRLGGLV